MNQALNLIKIRKEAALLPLAFLGSVALAVSAQVSIPLPFTLVPVTGQTFAVMLLALMMGRKVATYAFAMYLLEGAMGLPVFAQGKNLALLGPSFGYLIGMFAASYAVGTLADLAARKSFWLSLASCYCGSLLIFSFGAWGLSFFMPVETLFAAGVAPFLIGDFIKNSLAAAIASRKVLRA